ncbi:oxidoreductase, 2-nitropropane dioxygenase family protein [Mycobacterium parascrofulaceum ATCC BAA-614]|uniref:Oxidoreductase, 2-nitropropane dioxygenase family protein n=1 Tax=Mycobacterium parascrofulaceum ATCC BAA-614 TaxID=525368 RepID=D5P438_9MYCO|nr:MULTISPECIES: nitronate monooxygenase [Mycobacterium]EFG79227.1 oxidoreductase, 2-nitropropane dioxygenase family protein [Mycobacterium parascrofulaceum ATCC BAA-614]OCB33764.1 oxidoreductase [Mycobacterium malmoense]
MTLGTRLTKFFGIEHPIVLAPMAGVSGGRLAAAVTSAGGLGLIGGGYGDSEWLRREFDRADGARVGCGFITWSLARRPGLLDEALQRRPAAVMLSFGELQPFADRIRAGGVPLIAQAQTLDHARQALDAAADVVVAQGGEAGGHGMTVRSTFTLVPDVVDLVAERSPETLVLAAGGVSDGRGLAAALALGADGVLVGTRLWASPEALVSPRAHDRALNASGDDTVRTRAYDLVRKLDWPAGYDARALGNAFLDTWHGNEEALAASLPEAVADYEKAVGAEDFDTAAILVGEGVGQIRQVRPAADIVADMVAQAARALNRSRSG